MNSKAKLGLYMICQIHIKSPSLLKLLLSISLFSMILIASSGFFPAMTLHNAKAQQPAPLSSNFSSSPSLNETNPNAITITVNNSEEVISESYNTISNGSEGNLSAVLLNQIVKPTVLESMGNKSRGVSIVVGVITPNGTSVSGYGNISKADSTKVNGDTIFEVGSFTKTFTAALLSDMVKRGIVNLDDPIEKYLPSNNVTVPSYNGHKITLENLATHTSGLPDIPQSELDNRTYSTQKAYNFISNSSFVSEPGTRYNYSNIGVGLLGHALSLKAGIPYEQLVRDRILNVLGMNSTGIIMNNTQITTPHPDLLKSKAKGHMGGKEISFSLMPEIIQPTGAGYSSANDLLKYLSANMGLIDTKINDILKIRI
jgi:serine-type D-Ala-D-Ala carboxypeptidase/endopeptidase